MRILAPMQTGVIVTRTSKPQNNFNLNHNPMQTGSVAGERKFIWLIKIIDLFDSPEKVKLKFTRQNQTLKLFLRETNQDPSSRIPKNPKTTYSVKRPK